jgi:hypothetical protein
VIVWRASVEAVTDDLPPPGTIGPGPDFRLATADAWLVLDEVQPAGGRQMPGADLLRGRAVLAYSQVL